MGYRNADIVNQAVHGEGNDNNQAIVSNASRIYYFMGGCGYMARQIKRVVIRT